jgi:hypothetical protein
MSLLSPRRTAVLTLAAAALSAPTGAHAAITADQVPGPNVSTGRFTLPLQCKIALPWLGNIKILTLPATVQVAGAMPSSLGPGQRFYLSKASGRLVLPGWLSNLAPFIGASQARATVPQINIRAAGAASTEVVNMAKTPLTVSGIKLTPGRDISVGLPLNGYFTVGPWTAPQSGAVTLSFKNATARVDLQTSSGLTLTTVSANCTTASNLGLATIDVGGAPGQPDALIEDAAVDSFSAPPSGFDNGVISAGYQCALFGQEYTTAVAFSAISPLRLAAGAALTFQKANGAVVLPPAAVNALLDRDITTISGRVRRLELIAEGATPASIDVVAGQSITFGPTTLTRDRRAVILVPGTGDLTVGPFTRVGTQTIRTLGGPAMFELDTREGAASVSCTPPTNPRVFIGPTL